MSTNADRAAPAPTETAPAHMSRPTKTAQSRRGIAYSAQDTAERKPVSRFGKAADTLAVLFAVTALIAAIAAAGIIADAIPSWAFVLSLFGVFTCGLVILWRLP